MARILEFFPDGRIYELENDYPIKVIETEGKVRLLTNALQFTKAEQFKLAPPEKTLPIVATPRGQHRTINQEGLNLIKAFEGLYLEAYQDPVGIWTIGYGHIQGVTEGMKITLAQAEELLRQDLARYETAVQDAVEVTINEDQFSALTSFCFNLGAGSLFRSTLLKLLNQGKIAEAANEFPRWDKAGGQPLLGLSRRRRAERALFLSQSWSEFRTWKPSKILRLAKPGEPLMKGEEVRRLQQALIDRGFILEADGIFGQKTDLAVKEFQQQHGLTVDGIVGAETKSKLGLIA